MKRVILFFTIGMVAASCTKHTSSVATPADSNYQQVNLVSDTAGFGAEAIDFNLANPWGMAFGPTGSIWIAANHAGLGLVYNSSGGQFAAPVALPANGIHNGASATGVVYNNTLSFVIPSTGQLASYIFATEDGIITARGTTDTANGNDSTITVAGRASLGAVYKGLAIANDGSGDFIYAADFHNNRIDVFDHNFNYIPGKPFIDISLPAGYAPYNIQNIGGDLYVCYALENPVTLEPKEGVGMGYVDVYSPLGTLKKRFAAQGTLNAPWGIAQAPASFGQVTNAILIGNFGDGHINVYDAAGNYQGQLKNGSTLIMINGLRSIGFPTNNAGGFEDNILYFTAGPSNERKGLFGYLKLK